MLKATTFERSGSGIPTERNEPVWMLRSREKRKREVEEVKGKRSEDENNDFPS